MDPELVKRLLPMSLTHLAAFLLFVYLLKRFALGPVLQLLDDRREKIAREFDQIASSEKRVAALKDEYEEKIRKIDEEARKRAAEEVTRGRRIADEMLENARQEASGIIEKARAKLQIEVDQARERLKDDIVSITLNATERLLKERMNEDKHRAMVRSFVDELENRN